MLEIRIILIKLIYTTLPNFSQKNDRLANPPSLLVARLKWLRLLKFYMLHQFDPPILNLLFIKDESESDSSFSNFDPIQLNTVNIIFFFFLFFVQSKMFLTFIEIIR